MNLNEEGTFLVILGSFITYDYWNKKLKDSFYSVDHMKNAAWTIDYSPVSL